MVFEWIFKLFMSVQVAVFRLTKGSRMAWMRGMPVLLLNTTGRKSGALRTTPLMYIRDGGNYVITASNNGSDRHPGWFHNLQASGAAVIEVPGQRLKVSAAVASPDERERLWPQLVAQAPFFDAYRKGTRREIPMVILKPL